MLFVLVLRERKEKIGRLFMKKTLKKIAMILILVMLCNMFTSCGEMIMAVITGIGYLLIGSMVVGGVVGLIYVIYEGVTVKKRGPRRTNPYLFENSTFTTTLSSLSEEELGSLKETLQSLPKKELNSFIGRLNSLSEEESVSLMDSINSFSVQELAAIVETFNSMSETERISSIKSANSLPKTVSLANIVRNIEVDVSGEKAYDKQRFQY
jgi:hypothetical protein